MRGGGCALYGVQAVVDGGSERAVLCMGVQEGVLSVGGQGAVYGGAGEAVPCIEGVGESARCMGCVVYGVRGIWGEGCALYRGCRKGAEVYGGAWLRTREGLYLGGVGCRRGCWMQAGTGGSRLG